MVKTYPINSYTELTIGETVKITKRDKNMVFIEKEQTWVPASYVLSTKKFRPISEWLYKKKLEVGAGDYDGIYLVSRDGTFTVKETEQVPEDESYKQVRRKGQFYFAGNLYWAKVQNECVSEDRIFIKEDGKNICWQGFMGIAYRDVPVCPP
jgi:hypothetical protein